MTRAIQSLHKTLQLMIIYQPIKFGCQKMSTSVDVVEMAVYDCKSVIKLAHQFFCMTLKLMMLHYHTKFGYKRFSGSEDTVWTFTDILYLHCDLGLEHSIPIFSQDTQVPRCSKNGHILSIQTLTLTLTLKLAHHSFCMTLQLMMLHHHTIFDYKRFSDSKSSG